MAFGSAALFGVSIALGAFFAGRAHSESEMRYLLEQGTDAAVLAERELAYSMAEMVMAAPAAATLTPRLISENSG